MATSVHRVAKCIGYEGSRQLLRKDGHYAVCFLLSFVVDAPNAKALLHDIAELISMDEKQMLKEYFPVCIRIGAAYLSFIYAPKHTHICKYSFFYIAVHMQLCVFKDVSCKCNRMFETSFKNLTDEFVHFNTAIVYGNRNETSICFASLLMFFNLSNFYDCESIGHI